MYANDTERYRKVAELWLTEDEDDMQLARKWFQEMVGEKTANCNLFLLTFFFDIDFNHEKGVAFGKQGYWKLIMESEEVEPLHIHHSGCAIVVWDSKNILNVPFACCSHYAELDELKIRIFNILLNHFHREGFTLFNELFLYTAEHIRKQISNEDKT